MNSKWVRRVAVVAGLGAMALGGAGCATMGGEAYAAEGGGGGAGVSVSLFYDTLAPYGSWEWVEGYGRVWRPDPYVVGADFQPYSTGGQWVYTDYGWTWESDWDWGWAPFHYGRWAVDPVLGWVWVPGTVWGPAWVDWRFGGGYVGWCPLGPDGYGYGYTVGYHPYWSFVETRYFVHHDPYHYAVPVNRIHYAYQATEPVHHPVNYNQVHWNAGPPPGQIAHAAGVQIHPYPIRPPPPGQVAAVRPVGLPARPPPAGVSGGFHATPPGSTAYGYRPGAVPPGRSFGNTPPSRGFGQVGVGGTVAPPPGRYGGPSGPEGQRPPTTFGGGTYGTPPGYGQVPGGFRTPPTHMGNEAGGAYRPAPPPSSYTPPAYRPPATSGGGYAPPPSSGYRPPSTSGGGYAPPPSSGYRPPATSGGGYSPPPSSGYHPPSVGGGFHAPSGGGGYRPPPSGGVHVGGATRPPPHRR